MTVQVSSDNIDLSQSMDVLAREKLTRLENLIEEIPADSKEIRIVLNKAPNDTFLTKIELIVEGKKFYSEEENYSLESAIIATVDEVFRQYKKEKGKKDDTEWDKRRELKRFDATEEVIEE
jgi:ribosome-associated translation inhibitor RaiA